MGDDPNISTWETVVQAEALDISMKGMRLKAFYDVALGSFLSVVVYYEGHESIALCEVVWKREAMGEMIYGLFFKEWSKLDPILERALTAMEAPAESSQKDSETRFTTK